VQKPQHLYVGVDTAVENIMFAFHHVSEIGAQHWMVSPQFGELNQQSQLLFEAMPVKLQLLFAPGFERVLRNIGLNSFVTPVARP
jgi:hypothetical protein